MSTALGLLEIRGFTPAIAALDAMDKAGAIQVVQVELNDFYGVVIKVTGSTADVTAAIAAGHAIAEQMAGQPNSDIINRPDAEALKAIYSPREVSPLIQQDVVITPRPAAAEETMADNPSFALGLIETQGFTAVFEAIDSACKAANVEVLCKEKLGGGYVTVVIKGDVAAVKAAVDAGQAKVGALGKLIAAHVIARPSAGVLSLLPKYGKHPIPSAKFHRNTKSEIQSTKAPGRSRSVLTAWPSFWTLDLVFCTSLEFGAWSLVLSPPAYDA